MLRIIAVFLIVLFNLCELFAATYWVAPNGRLLGTGTENDPFPSIDRALDKVGGGNTFIFKPGVYPGNQITLYPKHSGTPQKPTVLKSQYKYKARLNGSLYHNIYVLENCNWVIIDGFESSGSKTGIKSGADYTVIRNCWIHNNAVCGIECHDVNGTIIENNLVEFNGKHPKWGHGMYVDGENIIIRNNIVRYNSATGLAVAPKISDSTIENNLVNRNHSWGVCLRSGGNNRLINNTIANNRYGIVIGDGLNEIVVNNIIWKNGTIIPIIAREGSDLEKVKMDYNLLYPTSKYSGPNSISSDPLFLEEKKDVYYLSKNSPAIGKASSQYTPSKDFFGRDIEPNKPLDLGCYQYEPFLLTPEAREGWFGQWPFCFSRGDPPDLWKLPPNNKDANVSWSAKAAEPNTAESNDPDFDIF
jgi:parallel beta-helix repeat protein